MLCITINHSMHYAENIQIYALYHITAGNLGQVGLHLFQMYIKTPGILHQIFYFIMYYVLSQIVKVKKCCHNDKNNQIKII